MASARRSASWIHLSFTGFLFLSGLEAMKDAKKYGVGGEGLAVVFVREEGVGHRKVVAGKRGGEKSEVRGIGKKLGGAGFEPAKA